MATITTAAYRLPVTCSEPSGLKTPVLLRFPPPYRAMLAICSDLDGTPNREKYLEIMRYLNTSAGTCMGGGLGLEVGNSIFFTAQPNVFAYWNTDEIGQAMVRELIHSGHIDCLHSFGNLARTREAAQRGLDELVKHDCRLEVWVDHSNSPLNFGPDIMCGQGDVVGTETYHADLTMQYGIRYLWRGRTTGIIGQDAPVDRQALAGILCGRHLARSTVTMLKEAAKVHLGRTGHPRWEMYAANRVYRPSRLRDGQPVWEFMRSNSFWSGTGSGADGDGIGEVLTRRMLARLVEREAVCILYTHLGKTRERSQPFGCAAQSGFLRLAEFAHTGRILVATTRRVLNYLTVRDHLGYQTEQRGTGLVISIESVRDPVFGPRVPSLDELQGITFGVPSGTDVTVQLNGTPVETRRTKTSGRNIITIPWRRLEFPDDV